MRTVALTKESTKDILENLSKKKPEQLREIMNPQLMRSLRM